MPRFLRDGELAFPAPETATEEGIVAVGGELSPERLVLAYSQGIFPWPHEGLPLLWFSPDPRFVIDLQQVHLPRSLRKRARAAPYEIRADTAFADVIDACARVPRADQAGTWITDEMRLAYLELHERGLAHSVEAWEAGRLVGGLYGIAIGTSFCGESMFSLRDDASKLCTLALLGNLKAWGFDFVDCQVHTPHLERFGATQWPRSRFLGALRLAVAKPEHASPWRFEHSPRGCLDILQPRR